jgi:hypothetical protein
MTYCSLARGLLTRPIDTASQREDKIPNLRKMYPSEMFPKLVNRYFSRTIRYHGVMGLRRSQRRGGREGARREHGASRTRLVTLERRYVTAVFSPCAD